MKKIRNLGPQTDSATKRLWLGDLGQVSLSLGKMTSDFPCGSNIHRILKILCSHDSVSQGHLRASYGRTGLTNISPQISS